MLLGILSDSHNELSRTCRAVELLRAEGAEVLIHCGDLSTAPIVSACAALPFYFVFGNHDGDNVPELRRAAVESQSTCLGWGGVVTLTNKRIGVVHGHLTTDVRRVLDQKPDYLLSGHAHFPMDRLTGQVRRINPGALFRADEFTVALLDLANDSVRFLKIAPEGT